MKSNTAVNDDVIARFAAFDPATLYEAAGQSGMVDPAIRPAWHGVKVCGRAFTVECPPGDNLMLHLAVAEAQPGAVIVACAGAFLLAGAWGEILTVAAQSRGIAGLVIDGAVRDIEAIERLQFPIFSRGLAIGACTKERRGKLDVPVQVGGRIVNPGDLILGDSDGLVVIDRDRIEEVLRAATSRQEKESEIIRQLRQGRTTIELLHLPDLRRAPDGRGATERSTK
jgi:4-hydroxy-4-methyl-2-oxoglutarate aldolase